MTQLLISVRNVEEALLALDAGVDIIDLKDPNVGALGALDLVTTKQIVQAINGCGLISATAGEQHASLSGLIEDINLRAQLGVDMIKIAVSVLFYEPNFIAELSRLTREGVKIVAVFFADEALNLNLFATLQNAGFFGAMLDTKNKQHHLLEMQTKNTLQIFTQLCKKHHLISGFAGSLKPQYIGDLVKFNPTYIGFRGGVCENSMRNSTLSLLKVMEVGNMLRIHNNFNKEAQEAWI
ncbi:MAG: (5-formylfuran-3-yl)methyl phosphate synthase [Methylotenera sp.]